MYGGVPQDDEFALVRPRGTSRDGRTLGAATRGAAETRDESVLDGWADTVDEKLYKEVLDVFEERLRAWGVTW